MTKPNPDESPKSASDNSHDGEVPPSSSYDDLRMQGKLIVLATFTNAPEAHCLRIELEHHGIRAAVNNEQSAQTVGASLFGRISAIWIEVVVLDSDAEAALKIKEGFLSEDTDSEISEWECTCGETVDAGFAQCWACMKPHPDLE